MHTDTQDIPFKENLYSVANGIRSEGRKFYLAPIGIRREPNDATELKRCLTCILTCLSQFHRRRYVHCDIRWPNIICVMNGNMLDWYLIDFTLSKSLDDSNGLREVANVVRREFVFRGIGPWTARHDLYQVGLLINASLHQAPFVNIMNQLMNVDNADVDIQQIMRDINEINV